MWRNRWLQQCLTLTNYCSITMCRRWISVPCKVNISDKRFNVSTCQLPRDKVKLGHYYIQSVKTIYEYMPFLNLEIITSNLQSLVVTLRNTSVVLKQSSVCSQNVCVCCVRISEQTAIKREREREKGRGEWQALFTPKLGGGGGRTELFFRRFSSFSRSSFW